MADNYAVNYDDERFDQVEEQKQEALTDLEDTYGGMISDSDKYFQEQIDATKDWADKQAQIQQDNTDFAIEQIEQQKDQAEKDYLKEQSGAYVDWQKQSNQYGVEAEKMASAGLDNSGYSESSQVSMYNTYQNRVAMARDSFSRAVLNYDNAIKDAQLQNNALLAEIAYQALDKQLSLSLQGFQYKNQLIIDKANKKTEIENTYWNRYQDVLQQINTENAMAEQIRQFEQNYELQVKQFDEEVRQYNQTFNEQVRQFNEEIARLKKKDEQEYQMQIQQLELQKKQLEEQKRQHDDEMAYKKSQLDESKRQFDLQYKKASGSSSGGSTTSKKTTKSGSTTTAYKQAQSEKFSQKTTATKNAPINSASVLALGYGPISESKLANLVAKGEVTSYVQNGQRYFKKATPKYKKLPGL